MGAIEQATAQDRWRPILAWLPSPYVRVALKQAGGRWQVLAIDFNVAGAGSSEPEAIREMVNLLQVYWESFIAEGRPFADAVNPVPLHARIHLWASAAMYRLTHRVIHRGNRLIANFVLPSAMYSGEVPTHP